MSALMPWYTVVVERGSRDSGRKFGHCLAREAEIIAIFLEAMAASDGIKEGFFSGNMRRTGGENHKVRMLKRLKYRRYPPRKSYELYVQSIQEHKYTGISSDISIKVRRAAHIVLFLDATFHRLQRVDQDYIFFRFVLLYAFTP